ncbi:MAG: hypothetical protein H0U42_02860 [Thermoleophilaceae bacterium]|nr:hypothetical protein [Thermoleophilaceae bacterium]
MADEPSFAQRRLRWRLRGAWQWPTFVVLTVADGLILHLLPPLPGGFALVPALIVSSFSNLFLVAAIAPWLARRLAERDAETPLEVYSDRVGTTLLALGTVGLVITGLGNQPLVVSETERTERLGAAVRDYVRDLGAPEIQRNLETANTFPTDEDGYFRTCIALDDRTRAFCMFVDTEETPPLITRDSDQRPNAVYFNDP